MGGGVKRWRKDEKVGEVKRRIKNEDVGGVRRWRKDKEVGRGVERWKR